MSLEVQRLMLVRACLLVFAFPPFLEKAVLSPDLSYILEMPSSSAFLKNASRSVEETVFMNSDVYMSRLNVSSLYCLSRQKPVLPTVMILQQVFEHKDAERLRSDMRLTPN